VFLENFRSIIFRLLLISANLDKFGNNTVLITDSRTSHFCLNCIVCTVFELRPEFIQLQPMVKW